MYAEVKRVIAEILREFHITADTDFASMDTETGAELYEELKARVLEQYDVSEDEVDVMLDEVARSLS